MRPETDATLSLAGGKNGPRPLRQRGLSRPVARKKGAPPDRSLDFRKNRWSRGSAASFICCFMRRLRTGGPCPPKAEVTGSNPVGRANQVNDLSLSLGDRLKPNSPQGNESRLTSQRPQYLQQVFWVPRGTLAASLDGSFVCDLANQIKS